MVWAAWLSSTVSDDDVEIPKFKKPFCYRNSGGVATYVRDTLHAISQNDLQINGVEAVWVEIHVCQRKLLVGGIYRSPNSNNTHWLNMEHSLDQAFNQHIDNILVAGDYNSNINSNPSNRMSWLIDPLNSEQKFCRRSLCSKLCPVSLSDLYNRDDKQKSFFKQRNTSASQISPWRRR